MSSFPPKQWQVRYLKDLETMQGTVREDKPISLEALLAIQPSEGEEGTFRFTLAGPQHLQMRIRVTDILQEKAFDNMWLSFQMELGTQIKLEKNSVASKWMDMVEMVNAQDIDVTDAEGEEVNEAFLLAMETLKKQANAERSGKNKYEYDNIICLSLQ